MFEIDFANAENMQMFWDFTKSLLKTASPWVLISFATVAVGWLLKIIVDAFRSGNDDDDDYDIRHY